MKLTSEAVDNVFSGRSEQARMPRWLSVTSGIVTVLVVLGLAFVVVMPIVAGLLSTCSFTERLAMFIKGLRDVFV